MAFSQTRTARSTGTDITVCTAEEAGADPEDGKWVIICEPHGTIMAVDTLAVARSWAPAPEQWCEDCQEHVAR